MKGQGWTEEEDAVLRQRYPMRPGKRRHHLRTSRVTAKSVGASATALWQHVVTTLTAH